MKMQTQLPGITLVLLVSFIGIMLSPQITMGQIQAFALSRNDSADINAFEAKASEFVVRKDLKSVSDNYNKIATVYWEHNHFVTAAKYFEKSLEINKKLGNENGVAMINSNLGLIYFDNEEYDKSLQYFEETLAARKANKEPVGMTSSLINISVVLNKIGKYAQSIKNLEEALTLSLQRKDVSQMRSCYGMLAETYEKIGDQKKVMQYFELYRSFNELVQKENLSKINSELKFARLQKEISDLSTKNKILELSRANRQIERQEGEIIEADSTERRLTRSLTQREMSLRLMKQERKIVVLENQRKQRKIEEERNLRIGILAVSAVILFLLLLMVRAYRNKRKVNNQLVVQNSLIQEQQFEIVQTNENLGKLNAQLSIKNTEVASSINYASLIQTASIFQREKLSNYTDDSFIFFLPKDIVSGDFYWYEKIGDLLIVAAVDCTGHGVPGGFVSMVANNLMNSIVRDKQITSPSKILMQLDLGMQSALNQRDNRNKDGMDLALCTIDFKEKKIYYSGAKNPLLYFRDGEMIYQKASRVPIGGYYRGESKIFDEHVFDFGSENLIYLYSDGFQDQFGGPKDRKYSNTRFRNFIYSIRENSFNKQHEELLEELNNWKANKVQIDDILIIGLKF